MEATGQLIFVKNQDLRNRKGNVVRDGKVFGRWEGGPVLEFSAELLESANSSEFTRTGRQTFRIACMNLDLRMVGVKAYPGQYRETYLLMRDGARARLLAARFNFSAWLVLWEVRTEAFARRLLGQETEGKVMPGAVWLTKRLGL